MSSRLAEKERRRTKRVEQEHQLAAERRRRRKRELAAGAGFVLLAAGGVVAAALLSSGGGNSSGGARGAFGTHYTGLVARRRTAGVPTMMQTMSSSVHYHPRLRVLVDGKQIPVPANIGIDPSKDPMQMAGLHTHDSSGTIHVEGVEGATLGEFFQIWGVQLLATQLGPYRASGPQTMRMWVNGKPSTAFGSLRLADGQRIVISYGPLAPVAGSTPSP